MNAEFQETVQTWNHKPSFSRTVITKGDIVEGEVSTKDKIYGYVSEGTKRHFVTPRRARKLSFRSVYNAKTKPGKIPSGGGGASGNTVFSNGHWVKGIEAREFPKHIKKDTEDRFDQYMNEALSNILEVIG